MAAGRIKGITIEINGDSTKLTKALSQVDRALHVTQSNLRDLNKALKLDPGNTELLKDKQAELGKAIEDTKSKIETEKQALEQMKSTEGFDANSQAARDLKVQIDLDTAALKELESQARQSSSVLGTQMQLAGQKIQEVGDKIKGVGDKITGIGQSLTAKVTAPIVGAFGASVKAAVDWESAFNGVRKTVDASEKEYEQLAKNIKKMATETASSREEIAGVMEIAGQLGITGVEGLTTFTRTMVDLGVATNLSAEEAATALARFMNITGESATDVDKIGSAVVALGNNFATSEAEIVAMSTRLAASGTIAGMTSTDILALSTAMSSVGIQAEAGGTAMTQTLSAMTAAVADFEAGSAEDLEKIASVANMSAEEFAKAWNEHPIEAVQNFIAGLGTLDEKGENATLVLDELGMSGVRQANMLKSLSLASNVLADAIQTSSDAYQKNSALSDEAAIRYAELAARIKQLKENFKNVTDDIAKIVIPYINKFIDTLNELIEKWKGLDDSQKESIVRMAAIAAAIGPILLVVGKLVSSIGSVVTVGGKLVSGIGTLMNSVGGLSGALSALAGPVGIVIAAVAALAAGFVYLYNTNDEFRAKIQETVAVLKENFGKMVEQVQPKLEALGQAFQGLMDMLAPTFEFLFTTAVAFISGIIEAISPIIDVVTNVIEFITNIVQAFFALMEGDFSSFGSFMMAAIQNVLNAITGILQAIVNFWLAFFKTFGVNLKILFTNIWNGVKIVVTTVVTAIKEIIEEKWTAIKEWITETITAIKEKFEEIFEKIKEVVSEKIEQAKEAIITGMEEAVDYIKSLPQKFYEWGSDMVQQLIDGIQSKIEAVKAKVQELANAIAGYIHFSEPDVGPLSNFHTFMPDMIDMMIQGIDQGIPRLQSAMNGLAGSMVPQLQNGANSIANTNNVVINVYGAQGQDPNALVDIIEERLTENMMRRGAAFG